MLEKMTRAKFVDIVGKESFYLSIEDAIKKCQFSLGLSSPHKGSA